MPIPLSTASSNGILVSIDQIADRLMAYFFTNNASQSNIYQGSVYSLQSLVMRYKSDPGQMCRQMQLAMTTMLQNHFESVEAIVEFEEVDPGLQGKYNLRVNVDIVDEGNHYNLGRLLQVYQGKFYDVRKTYNGV